MNNEAIGADNKFSLFAHFHSRTIRSHWRDKRRNPSKSIGANILCRGSMNRAKSALNIDRLSIRHSTMKCILFHLPSVPTKDNNCPANTHLHVREMYLHTSYFTNYSVANVNITKNNSVATRNNTHEMYFLNFLPSHSSRSPLLLLQLLLDETSQIVQTKRRKQ